MGSFAKSLNQHEILALRSSRYCRRLVLRTLRSPRILWWIRIRLWIRIQRILWWILRIPPCLRIWFVQPWILWWILRIPLQLRIRIPSLWQEVSDAEPEADADAAVYYGGYYGHPYRYGGYYGGYPYRYGGYYGYGAYGRYFG